MTNQRKIRATATSEKLLTDRPVIGEEIELINPKSRNVNRPKLDDLVKPIVDKFFQLELNKGFSVSHTDPAINESYRRHLVRTLNDEHKGQQCRTHRPNPNTFQIFRIQ